MQGRVCTWSGDYRAWDEALSDSEGYDAPGIIERVAAAAWKVQRGEAAFERDTITFDSPDYAWPVLAGLLWISARRGRLDLVDFGGALGSTYHQHRRFLASLPEVCWSVVEQPHFVEEGRKHFQDDRLRFYASLEACRLERAPDTVLLASVLPYLRDPYALIDEIIASGCSFLILDRTTFNVEARDRLTVQTVPERFYRASYPCWFFDERRLKERLATGFELVAEFENPERTNIPSYFKGMIFERRG